MVVTAGGGGAIVNGGRAPSVLTRRQHARNRREARATYVQQRRAVTAIDVCVFVCVRVCVRVCLCMCHVHPPRNVCTCMQVNPKCNERKKRHARTRGAQTWYD